MLWHGYVDVEGDALAEAAKKFNATHPKIHVTVQNYGNADNALQKVLTAIRGGSYPDIAYLYGSWAANMARTPKAVDLAPLIKADPSINWNDFWPAERQAVTVGDKIVGVPALVDNLALVYNKKLFDRPAWPSRRPTGRGTTSATPRSSSRMRRRSSSAGPTWTTRARTPCGASTRCSGRPAATS